MHETDPRKDLEMMRSKVPPEYKSLFTEWTDEDVKRYIHLINSTTPEVTYARTLEPSIVGLSTALHERAEMTMTEHFLSQKNGSDFQFKDKLRQNMLRKEELHSYFTPEAADSPRRLYFAAHRIAYRIEMQFVQDLAQAEGHDLSRPAIYATSPRLLNDYADRLITLDDFESMYLKETRIQLGDEAGQDEYKDFPSLDELRSAFTFWQKYGSPYTEKTLHKVQQLLDISK